MIYLGEIPSNHLGRSWGRNIRLLLDARHRENFMKPSKIVESKSSSSGCQTQHRIDLEATAHKHSSHGYTLSKGAIPTMSFQISTDW